VSNSDHPACTARTSRSQRLIVRAADAAAAADEPARSIDGMAKAIGGAQVNKQSVLVVGATGTLGRQVRLAKLLTL
jgi:FlaA1/EpsC-like NDP-sugar epimerase